MQTILITGANRGIGLALCERFLDAGWQVLATCRDPGAATALEALAHLGRLRILSLDVTDAASVAALAVALQGQTVDVLFNNAGIMGGAHQGFADMDYDAWLHTLDVNVLGPMRVCQALLPNLLTSKSPRIVTVSSQMGAFGLDMGHGTYAYRTSKSAASKAMQLLASELREQNVVVVPVHPGWVKTDMGGPNAQITPGESASGLYDLVTTLTMEHTGRFWTWEGREHVW